MYLLLATDVWMNELKEELGYMAVWLDVAKFHHFGKNFKSLIFFVRFLVFGKILKLFLQNLWFYWANFHCCNRSNIDKHCNHMVTLLLRPVHEFPPKMYILSSTNETMEATICYQLVEVD